MNILIIYHGLSAATAKTSHNSLRWAAAQEESRRGIRYSSPRLIEFHLSTETCGCQPKVKTVLILLLCSLSNTSVPRYELFTRTRHIWKRGQRKEDELSLLDQANIYKTFFRKAHSPAALRVYVVPRQPPPPAPHHTVLMNEMISGPDSFTPEPLCGSPTFQDHSHDLPEIVHHILPHAGWIRIIKVALLLQLWPTWRNQSPLSFPVSHVATRQPFCVGRRARVIISAKMIKKKKNTPVFSLSTSPVHGRYLLLTQF